MNNGPLTAVKYNDGNDVFMLSTSHPSHSVATGKRDPTTGNDIHRPCLVNEYNKFMGGVDRSDQMVAYNHPVGTIKWWKKVFFHILNLAVLNAYIVYKESSDDQPVMLQRIFRRKLVAEMVESAGVPAPACTGGRPASQRLKRLDGRHFPGKGPSRNCIVCNDKQLSGNEVVPGQKRKRPDCQSNYTCKQCNVALCIIRFEIYHTKQEYVLAYKRWKQANAVPEE